VPGGGGGGRQVVRGPGRGAAWGGVAPGRRGGGGGGGFKVPETPVEVATLDGVAPSVFPPNEFPVGAGAGAC